MYLIVSATNNLKPKFYFNDIINMAKTIGHEIHVTRQIVLLLLSMNLIDTNVTIVTKNYERFFLYNNIFKNVMAFDDLSPDIDKSKVIDLTQANRWFHDVRFLNNDSMMQFTDIERRFPIMTHIRKLKSIPFRNEKFNNMVLNINYINISHLIKKDFVIIHHRIVDHKSWYNKENYTQHIIDKVRYIDPDVQIFIFSVEHIEISSDITIISDIPTYASLLQSDQCKAYISEFSGGGQLSQYCHKNKIFYFFNTHRIYGENKNTLTDINEVVKVANRPTNFYEYFDVKIFTDASMYFFWDISVLLGELDRFYFNTEKRKYLRI